MNKENKTPNNSKPMAYDALLATVPRPQMANEALAMLKEKKEIEIETPYVFAFLRAIENHEQGRIKINCSINKYNQGYTALVAL